MNNDRPILFATSEVANLCQLSLVLLHEGLHELALRTPVLVAVLEHQLEVAYSEVLVLKLAVCVVDLGG